LSRRGQCDQCGQQRRLVSPPGDGARRCADCAGIASGHRCVECGTEDRLYSGGRCVRCALAERAARLLGGPLPELRPVYDAIVAARQPYSAHNWLRSAAAAAILADMASGHVAVTHETLDAHPKPLAASFLRAMLVAHNVLPARDDALVDLEAWVTARLDEIDEVARRRLLRSYATWRVLRGARTRAARRPRTRTAVAHAKTCLLAAIAFTAWLAERGVELRECHQAHIDTWSSEGGPAAHETNDFLDWAAKRHLATPLVLPGPHRQAGVAMHSEQRWAVVDRLLHDDTVVLADRVAGCLVLLYAQQLSRIVTLTVDQVTTHDNEVHINLGTSQAVVPEPLGGLLVQQAAGVPVAYNGVGSPATTLWLFPGLHPGRPLHPSTLGQRLRRLGVPTMAARRAALMHLASQLPAAVLAELLHLHPTTAVSWVAAAGGDWNTYAAQIVRSR
jgi:hypothetical protein